MKKITTIFLALLIISGISYSQKKFTLSFFGGYSMPVADLKGDFPDTLGNTGLDFSKSKTLLTSKGFNGGIRFKYIVDTTGSARITGSLNYNSFSGSVDYPKQSITYNNRVGIFSISAGIEYAVNPEKKIVPYGGLELAVNFFSGKIEGSGDTTFIQNRKSETRFGVIANAGAEFRLWQNSGLIIGAKYSMTNLIGKKTETTTTASNNVDAEEQGSGFFNELPLNDEETSTNPDGKTLNFLQFYAGIYFNFGSLLSSK